MNFFCSCPVCWVDDFMTIFPTQVILFMIICCFEYYFYLIMPYLVRKALLTINQYRCLLHSKISISKLQYFSLTHFLSFNLICLGSFQVLHFI
jgi:hypothetical protein